jgi:hypothetical protein
VLLRFVLLHSQQRLEEDGTGQQACVGWLLAVVCEGVGVEEGVLK